MKPRRLLPLLLALVLSFAALPVWALGEETFGNAPLGAANYTETPELMPVINHSSRVYHTWVNGNEHFYYHGGLDALNEALRLFGAAQGKKGEIILRPGPGATQSLQGKEVAFDWSLHLIGGIARLLPGLPGGAKVWNPNPTLTIYTSATLDPAKLQFPKDTPVVAVQTLKVRAREGLKSADKTVRGWGAGELAALDPYDAQDRDVIAGLLKDPDNWVRLNAAGALAFLGRTAEPALPLLREALNTEDPQLKERVQDAIRKIEQAPDRAEAEKEHRKLMERIQAVISGRRE